MISIKIVGNSVRVDIFREYISHLFFLLQVNVSLCLCVSVCKFRIIKCGLLYKLYSNYMKCFPHGYPAHTIALSFHHSDIGSMFELHPSVDHYFFSLGIRYYMECSSIIGLLFVQFREL